MPRMLRGVQNRNMATTVLGYKVSAPIGIGNSYRTCQYIAINQSINHFKTLKFSSISNAATSA